MTRRLRWPPIILWAIVIAVAIALFGSLAYADPVKDTRQIMAGTVTTTKIKNEYLSGARDNTTPFKGALSAYKAVRAAEQPAPVPVPAPTPTPLPASAYDTSIGLGVDSNGFANLPLRAEASRYYVNSAIGSDANGCSAAKQPATPLKTITAGMSCITQWARNGDQVLIAEGTNYNEGLSSFDPLGGYSPAYPTVVQSYDPADPTNEAKIGRAGPGRRPVVNTGGNGQLLTCCTSGPASSFAIRGLDFNPGDKPDMGIAFNASGGLPNNHVLIENNIFRFTGLGFNQITAKGVHHVIRKNAFYGMWSATGHAQALFEAGTDGLTVEDNVFYHVGWKLGVPRDTPPSLGGPTIFRHSIYQQTNTNALVRRNIIIDPSASGCSCRGDATILENVFIDNPIPIVAGLGDNYDVSRPNGVALEIGFNAIIGDSDIDSMNPRGFAIWTGNGKPGSTAHDNLIVRSRNPNGTNVYAFTTQASLNQPSYMTYRNNLSYRFSTPTYLANGAFPAQVFAVYDRNAWDAPASGTNVNSASMAFPNPMTSAGLFTALGCGIKEACAMKMVETPEADWAGKARALLFTGYGMPAN